jgi:NTE family protein
LARLLIANAGLQEGMRNGVSMPKWTGRLVGLVRHLLGPRTLGLALGGGGVRGLAHMGVLAVLDREGIPVSAIAGTSMGAIIGGAYALHPEFDRARLTQQIVDLGIKSPILLEPSELDADGFVQRLRRFIDVERFLIDTMWGWGAFEGTAVANALETLTGGKTLEAARIPFAAVAADLLTGEEVVFRNGPAALALQASSALPGFFPPVRQNGRLLADGAVVDLVPARVVRRMGVQAVVAVDVDQENIPAEITNGLQAFLRAVEISARHHKQHHLLSADLVIRPDFGSPIDSLDFSKAQLCVEAGEHATERALPALRRLLRRDADRGTEGKASMSHDLSVHDRR